MNEPLTIGDSSPAVTATMASSSSPSPTSSPLLDEQDALRLGGEREEIRVAEALMGDAASRRQY